MAHDQSIGRGKRRARDAAAEAEYRERLGELLLRDTKLSTSEAALFEEVFPGILRAHRDRVLRQIRRWIDDEEDAEEIAQVVFLQLYAQIRDEGFPGNVGALLHTMASRRVLNHLRDASRDPVSVGLPSSSSEPPKTAPSAEGAMDRRELARRILERLSDDDWAVVDVVIMNEVPHRDAAVALGIPIGTLKSRIRAVKDRMYELAVQMLPPSQREA